VVVVEEREQHPSHIVFLSLDSGLQSQGAADLGNDDRLMHNGIKDLVKIRRREK
jgi:hypothetical protein